MTHLSKSDYYWVVGADVDEQHPYGDMDRMRTSFNPSDVIRGRIMPLRHGLVPPGINGKQILSGEDLCYIGESVAERKFLDQHFPVSSGGYTFSGHISSNYTEPDILTMSHVAFETMLLYGSSVKSISSQVYDVEDSDIIVPYSYTDVECNPDSFLPDSTLQAEEVMKIFNDLRKFSTMYIKDIDNVIFWRYSYIVHLDYTSDYPMTNSGEGIFWFGGYQETSTRPNHYYGGIHSQFYRRRFYVNMDEMPPSDKYSIAECSAYLNVHFSYMEEDSSGNIIREESSSYFWQAGDCSVSGNMIYFIMDEIQLFNVARKVSKEKFGWDLTRFTLPDEFGKKVISIDRIYCAFTLPVSKTVWWD